MVCLKLEKQNKNIHEGRKNMSVYIFYENTYVPSTFHISTQFGISPKWKKSIYFLRSSSFGIQNNFHFQQVFPQNKQCFISFIVYH